MFENNISYSFSVLSKCLKLYRWDRCNMVDFQLIHFNSARLLYKFEIIYLRRNYVWPQTNNPTKCFVYGLMRLCVARANMSHSQIHLWCTSSEGVNILSKLWPKLTFITIKKVWLFTNVSNIPYRFNGFVFRSWRSTTYSIYSKMYYTLLPPHWWKNTVSACMCCNSTCTALSPAKSYQYVGFLLE